MISVGCFQCGDYTHMAKDCPNGISMSNEGSGPNDKTCFKCRKVGHIAKDCIFGNSTNI